MAVLINGTELAKKVKAEVRLGAEAMVEALGEEARPDMTLIVFEGDPVSRSLVAMKARDCEAAGIVPTVVELPDETTEEELFALIERLNADEKVTAILCQLPVPPHVSTKKLLNLISPEKDVDGFSARLDGDITDLAACTPAGVIRMLDEYGIEVAGKHCVVVGRSNIVGKPMAAQLLMRDATVTVCHSKTRDLASFTRQADVLIVAAGHAGLITADMVKDGAAVIDVGMNYVEGRLAGDVDFEGVSQKAAFISPVPGGVGPMTRAYLLKNALRLSAEKHGMGGTAVGSRPNE
ncbi:MAG: bifunctional 5,10-methylenetetrahydrofolate dehydrogenase/5,10-methenyltetrahydrofolate cyclohydrolase [Clostridiales bacterium]|nr:bifunctional 5,10-methylenetetrahydrofolate dehydrogenase/5,10-methenyltetrahydrofolate cyclohydrolase [Clostridiales bacterium]